MIGHMRESYYYFFDDTWYRPTVMNYLLILMFKVILTGEKIPGFFIVTNNRKKEIYIRLFIIFS